MPSTFLSLYYHIVFSTKDREPFISEEWRERLHEYLGGAVKGLSGVPIIVGGTADHVHLLVGLNSTHCLADFVRELKKASTAWVHEEVGFKAFRWQTGYGAFTVSPTSCERVKKYIVSQEQHHRTRPLREELIELLNRSGVDYNPAYLD